MNRKIELIKEVTFFDLEYPEIVEETSASLGVQDSYDTSFRKM